MGNGIRKESSFIRGLFPSASVNLCNNKNRKTIFTLKQTIFKCHFAPICGKCFIKHSFSGSLLDYVYFVTDSFCC